MHSSSIRNLERFFKIYLEKMDNPKILDLGGVKLGNQLSGKDIIKKFKKSFSYYAVDIKPGPNVDITLKNPYFFEEIEKNSFDIVISVSTFEHIEFFWLSYLEILKVLKQDGVFYLNVPSNGIIHRWYKDCWRFYPDSGSALINWGKFNNFNNSLLESFTTKKYLEGGWNDYNAIIIKDKINSYKYPARIVDEIEDFYNGMKNDDCTNIINAQHLTEDQNNFGYKLWYKFNKKFQKYFYKYFNKN